MSERREFSKAVRLAAFQRCKGHCEECTTKLYSGRFDYDHDKEDTFGGEPTLENCRVLCRACHDKKTRTRAAVIAKSNRIRNRVIGVKKKRTITSWRKFNGEIVHASRER